MTWQKGQSGNPVGLNAKEAALKRRLHGLTFKAVDALDRVLSDDAATHSERIAAAREVFDRAIGKPKQQATLTVEHGPNAHLAALLALSNKTIDAVRVQTEPALTHQPLTVQGVHTLEALNSEPESDDGSAR